MLTGGQEHRPFIPFWQFCPPQTLPLTLFSSPSLLDDTGYPDWSGSSLNARLMLIQGEIFSDLSARPVQEVKKKKKTKPSPERQLSDLSKRHRSSKTKASWLQNMWLYSPISHQIKHIESSDSSHFTLGIHNCNLAWQSRESFSLKVRHHLTVDVGRKCSITTTMMMTTKLTFKIASCPSFGVGRLGFKSWFCKFCFNFYPTREA